MKTQVTFYLRAFSVSKVAFSIKTIITVKILLYGLESHGETQNANIFNATMECLRCSNHFEEQLY